MRIDINSLDIEQSFWSLYPEFKAVEPFKTLYTKDKGKKEESSKVMWFVALCYHPTSSLSKLSPEVKLPMVSKDFMGQNTYYKAQEKTYEPMVGPFLTCTTTALERQLMVLEQKVEDRKKVVEAQVYDLSNYSDIDKMIQGADVLEKKVSEMRARITQEAQGGTSSRGDKELSASEQGIM